MKTYRVIAFFPQAPASRAEHEIRIAASGMHVAVYRALKFIHREKLKGLRVREAKISVRVV